MTKKRIFLLIIILLEIFVVFHLLNNLISKNIPVIVSVSDNTIYNDTYAKEMVYKMYQSREKLNPLWIWSNSSELLYELNPNSTFIYEIILNNKSRIRVKYTINEDGIRYQPHDTIQPNKTKTIVVIGDSHTFGSSVDDNETYVYYLEKILNDKCQTKFVTYNLGVPAYNLKQKITRLKSYIERYRPEIIIVQYDADDIFPEYFFVFVNKYLVDISKKEKFSKEEDRILYFLQIDNKIRNSFFQTSNIEKLKVENIERPLEELYIIQKSYNVSKIIFLIFWDLNQINTNKLNNYGWEYT